MLLVLDLIVVTAVKSQPVITLIVKSVKENYVIIVVLATKSIVQLVLELIV